MKSRIRTCLIAMIVLFAALVLPLRLAAQEQPNHYRLFNLGNLSGTASEGNTINNIGWAIGAADQSGDITEHATVWIYGLRFDLGTLGGPNSDVQWPNKNDHGQIAGFSETAAMDPFGESWSCTAFTPTGIPTGHVCTGFVWQFGVMTGLPTLGGNNGFASGENNLGQIVGWAETTVHDSSCVLPQVSHFRPSSMDREWHRSHNFRLSSKAASRIRMAPPQPSMTMARSSAFPGLATILSERSARCTPCSGKMAT